MMIFEHAKEVGSPFARQSWWAAIRVALCVMTASYGQVVVPDDDEADMEPDVEFYERF